MTNLEFSRPRIEARDINSDKTAMANRIESYRDQVPTEHPKLIVSPGQDVGSSKGIIPEIEAQQLSVDTLRAAINEHGSLIVRGLFADVPTGPLTAAIDEVLEACQRNSTGDAPSPSPFFNPPDNLRSIMPNKEKELGNTRNFHRDSGSAMCVEAPSVAELLLELYETHKLKTLLTEYLGEAPCLSAKKWVLRRSKLPVAEAGWHQDGAFMGTNINSINMWLPLGTCGGETGAPGMDVVAQRLTDIASAEGAQFDWSVSSSAIAEGSVGSTPLQPEFSAGDAFFFDHFFLHRTQFGPEFSQLRYAVETWFFGATSFPKNQIPLAW